MKTAAISTVHSTAELIKTWCGKYGIKLAFCGCVSEGEREQALLEIEENFDLLICDEEILIDRKLNIPTVRVDSKRGEIFFISEITEQLLKLVETSKIHRAKDSSIMKSSFCGIIEIDCSGMIVDINELAIQLIGCRGKVLKGRYILNTISSLEKEMLDTALNDGNPVFAIITDPYKNYLNINIEPIAVNGKVTGGIITVQRCREATEFTYRYDSEENSGNTAANYRFENFSCFSGDFSVLIKQAKFAAYTDAPILLYGEEGTERQEIAQCIHNASNRNKNSFVEIECNALDINRQDELLFGDTGQSSEEGGKQCFIEQCDGGTIFLNHVDKLAPEIQFKICRLIKGQAFLNSDYRQVASNIRVIAATDVNLWELVEKGKFRDDLYYALSVISLHVPPLRERKDDLDVYVDQLFEYYSSLYFKPVHLTAGVYECIREYEWPGNVKQLESFCQRIVLMTQSRSISEALVRSQIGNMMPKSREREENIVYRDRNADAILEALKRNNGSRLKAAEELGISTTTLWRKMQKYGITTNYST